MTMTAFSSVLDRKERLLSIHFAQRPSSVEREILRRCRFTLETDDLLVWSANANSQPLLAVAVLKWLRAMIQEGGYSLVDRRDFDKCLLGHAKEQGRPRSLLCFACNRTFRDSPEYRAATRESGLSRLSVTVADHRAPRDHKAPKETLQSLRMEVGRLMHENLELKCQVERLIERIEGKPPRKLIIHCQGEEDGDI